MLKWNLQQMREKGTLAGIHGIPNTVEYLFKESLVTPRVGILPGRE